MDGFTGRCWMKRGPTAGRAARRSNQRRGTTAGSSAPRLPVGIYGDGDRLKPGQELEWQQLLIPRRLSVFSTLEKGKFTAARIQRSEPVRVVQIAVEIGKDGSRSLREQLQGEGAP